MSSPAQREFVERLCRLAKDAGCELQEHDTALGHSFTWRWPDGSFTDGPISGERETALMAACAAIQFQLLNHV